MLLRLFKKLVPLLGLLFAFLVLRDNLVNIELSEISVSVYPLLISFILLLLLFYMDAIGWYLINRSLNVNAGLSETIKVWLLSSLSRYIPGVVWGYANRILFLKERKSSASIVALSLILESLFLAGGALLVGSYLLFQPAYQNKIDNFLAGKQNLFVVFFGVIAVACFLFFVFRKKLIAYSRSIISLVSFGRLLFAFFFYVILWFVFALAFGVFASSLIPTSFSLPTILNLGFCFSLAFGFSFLLIIFPGGIGVREVFLYVFLSVILDPVSATLVAALSRVWVIAAEMISVGGCWVYFSLKQRLLRNTGQA